MKEQFDKLYEEEGKAPWTFSEPDMEIISLEKKGKIKGKVLEIGCGEGYHSIYLASKGYEVTGIDFSNNALSHARKHSEKAGVKCKFLDMDFHNLSDIKEEFDFVFDWRFFHELISEKDRELYFCEINKVLKKDGLYLSVSFSGDSDLFGEGLLRKAPTGITLFFPTLEEADKIFSNYFKVIEKKHIDLPEKPDMEIKSNYLLMRRK